MVVRVGVLLAGVCNLREVQHGELSGRLVGLQKFPYVREGYLEAITEAEVKFCRVVGNSSRCLKLEFHRSFAVFQSASMN